MRQPKVLIVTGGMLTAKETSVIAAIKKQLTQVRASSGAWLDLQQKIAGAEHLIAAGLSRRQVKNKPYAAAVEDFFSSDGGTFETPELTEVILATLLEQEGLGFECSTYAELYANAEKRECLLDQCSTVFASTTLLRDLSELVPMMTMLKRPNNKVVAGGALTAILHSQWQGCSAVDVLAIGYGEYLVASLAAWIKGGHKELVAPEHGRLMERAGTQLLYSGVPQSKDLDHLPAPDWQVAKKYHGKHFRMAHYESVRGCPYRCSFCNYPFLFDDTKFRYRSAERIADDWQKLFEQGVEYIMCLDSLFTMPKRRLEKLCALLIAREIKLKWICYARADDLADLATCELMKKAGCHQVQIGIESGSDTQLANMNKRCTVENNRQALNNCRKVGLTSLATVIVGFPGETEQTVRETFEFLKSSPPDVFYVAPFNTRVEYVPILSAENRARFGLSTMSGGTSSAPYWQHNTMSCTQVGKHARWLTRALMENEVALEGMVFYKGLLEFEPKQRDALLAYQKHVATRHPMVRRVVNFFFGWSQRRLLRDVQRSLGNAPAGALVPAVFRG